MKLPGDALGRMLIRMTGYGLILGACAGFLLEFVLDLRYVSFNQTLENAIRLGAFCGCLFGLTAGGISGFLMVFATYLFFEKPRYKRIYLLMMAIITLCGTAFSLSPLIWFSGLSFTDSFVQGNFSLGILMSIVIAVYISQGVANKYLRESDPRKLKETMTI